MKKYSIIISVIITFAFTYAVLPQEDYEEWLKKQKAEYQNYLSEQDKEFVKFLKKEWKEFKLFQGNNFYEEEKPLDMPEYEPPDDKEPPFIKKNKQDPGKSEDESPPAEPENESEAEPQTPEPSPEKKIEPRNSDYPGIEIDPGAELQTVNYYGKEMKFYFPKEYKVEIDEYMNNEKVADFWGKTGSKNFEQLIEQAKAQRERMRLNDWGYFMLVKNIAGKVYPNSANGKHLFMWFLLVKSGYKAKAGIVNNKVYLFVPAADKIYGVPFINTDNRGYRSYIMNFDDLWGTSLSNSKIQSYDSEYPASTKPLDMNLSKAPVIADKIKSKTLKFSYQGENYRIPVKYNTSIVDFYEYYPYSNLEIYFKAGVSDETARSLIEDLKPIVAGKSEAVAANIILRFVQTAFDYKMDQPHFGREKPLFPEETIHYKYSDCEDRSILYSYLIKNLLNLNVIGVKYPGHLATAVNFNVDVKGDYIEHNGERYTICDPTYVNAYIGMTMPRFKGTPPKGVIDFN